MNPVLQFANASGPNSATEIATFGKVSFQSDTVLAAVFARNSSGNTPIISSLTDNADPPNDYEILIDWQQIASGGLTYYLRVYQASVQANPDTGNLAATVVTSIAQQRLTLQLVELTGLLPNPALDPGSVVSSSSAAATQVALTTSIVQGYEQAIAFVFPAGPLTPQGNWVLQAPQGGLNSSTLTLYNPPTGTNTLVIANQASGFWLASIVSFKAVPPPPPPPAPTSKVLPVGIFELIPFYNAGPTSPPQTALSSHAGWITKTIAGMTIRLYWQDFEPTQGNYDFSYLDSALALCEQYGKIFGLTLSAGTNSPSWIFSAGAEAFNITGQGTMPAPWDPIFQYHWGLALKAIANRYDGNFYFSYQVACGCGFPPQPNFCQSAADNAAMQADAIAKGFAPDTSGVAIWQDAYAKIFQLYKAAFVQTPVIGLNGPPVYPKNSAPWQQVYVSLIGQAPLWWWGLKDNGLSPTYSLTSWMANQISSMSDYAPVGFQYLHAAKTMATNAGLASPWAASQQALQIGCELGGKWIEIYPSDVLLGDLSPYIALLEANAAQSPPTNGGGGVIPPFSDSVILGQGYPGPETGPRLVDSLWYQRPPPHTGFPTLIFAGPWQT